MGDGHMRMHLGSVAIILLCLPTLAVAADPVSLSEETYKPDLGIIIVQTNWGRRWKCGPYENVQLQALTFTKAPVESADPTTLELETPSRLFVENKFLPYALVVQPGQYILTAFDVKIARSQTDVAHIKGSKNNLIKDGHPVGGSFAVNPGEIVYVGHFGLDCAAEPFLWRYYIDGRGEFESYVAGFRKKFPFVKAVPVHYRLFSTRLLGNPYSLQDPTVQ
jgi:hypothetical protein